MEKVFSNLDANWNSRSRSLCTLFDCALFVLLVNNGEDAPVNFRIGLEGGCSLLDDTAYVSMESLMSAADDADLLFNSWENCFSRLASSFPLSLLFWYANNRLLELPRLDNGGGDRARS